MRLPFNSLRFRLAAFPLALLVLWLALALAGAIYDARGRVAAEVQASLALSRALISAASSSVRDSTSTLLEVQKHSPATRHVRLGITGSPDPASIIDTAGPGQREWQAPSWFARLIAPERTVELVRAPSAGNKEEWIFIIPNPADEIGEVWQDFCYGAAICTALVFIIVTLSLWMARNVLRPIRALGDGLERLERDDFPASLEPAGFSELEGLRTQFNSLARSLKEKTIENQALCERLVSAQESERRLVLRELHDELGPCLFGIQAETASIRQSLRERGSGELVAARTRSIDALADTIQQINRRILHTVKPAALTERGLAAALRHLVDRWQETYPKITWSLDLSETDLEGLTAVADLAIYRMVQEGLTNVARHALCTEAGVTISKVTE